MQKNWTIDVSLDLLKTLAKTIIRSEDGLEIIKDTLADYRNELFFEDLGRLVNHVNDILSEEQIRSKQRHSMKGNPSGDSVNPLVSALTNVPTNADHFICANSNLILLSGFSPPVVAGGFWCGNNKLTSLIGGPVFVGGSFSCSRNEIVSLEHSPTSVGVDFFCSENQIRSLVGAPTKINGKFDCSKNLLVSLKGAPTDVGGDFICSGNPLASLEGFPLEIGGNIYIDSSCGFTEEQIRSVSKILGEIRYTAPAV